MEERGLNILCIDGGGVRGLSSLLLLSEIMSRIQRLEKHDNPLEPCTYFDVIAGTGTGALTACMLGRLELPVDQAINCYGNLVKSVFSDRKWIGSSGSAFKSSKLKEAVKAIIKEAKGNEHEPMTNSNAHNCRTIIFAMSRHHMSAGLPTVFRSYQGSANQAPDCAMWEAICASMAHPDLFKSVTIGVPPLQASFVDGGLACNNPLAHVLAEVRAAYPQRRVASVISIGAGHTCTIKIPDASLLHRFLPTNAIMAMKDMATDSERVAEEMSSRFNGTTGIYFRFNVDQGIQSVGLSEWERLDEVAAHARAYMHQDVVIRAMDSAARAIKERKPSLTTAQIDGHIQVDPDLPPTLSRCPPPTTAFTGRIGVIKQVEGCILSDNGDRRVCVVHGLGGTGKTQLVLRIVERTRERWAAVVYVDASSREAIESTLQQFAADNDLGETHDDTIRWLESRCKRWLLIFDNADTPSLNIRQFFPSGNHGSIIITTRLHDMVVLAKGPRPHCQVSSMDPREALELLIKMARLQDANLPNNEMKAAAALLEDFGYLALAIVHAGAYIGHSRISLSKYRELYLDRQQAMLEEYSKLPVKADDYKWTVYTTWKLCYDLLGDNAQSMLGLLAFLHYDGISENIFRLAAINMQSYEPQFPLTDSETTALASVQRFLGALLDSEGHWNSLAFLATINEISMYSLLEHDQLNHTYRIHVLVQDWARTLIPQPPDLALECTSTLLSLSVDGDNSSEARSFRRMLELHVNKVLSERQLPIGANHAASFAAVYSERGQWRKSEELQNAVVEAGTRTLGDKNPFTLTAKANLAMTYWKQGRWDQAETLEAEVVDERKQTLGEEHPHTLVAKANLAATFRKQRRWDEAEKLQLEVIDARTRTLGDDHPDVLTAKANLAATFQKQGRWDQAEKLQADIAYLRHQVLGKEHPNTLDAKASLAATYRTLGRWDKAETLEIEVVDAMERVLGEEHPHTLIAKANLAVTYQKQGRWLEAEKLAEGVVGAMERVLDEEHPHMLSAKANLAATYRKQGQFSKAEKLQLEVVVVMGRALGDEDLLTLDAKSSLAITFRKQGRLAEAEKLQVEVVEAMKRALSDTHSNTLAAKANLSRIFQKQGRWDEAESLQMEVTSAMEDSLGDKHPETLMAKANLAITLCNRGRWDDAKEMQVEVVKLSKQVLATNHPHTLQHEKTLQWICSEMGDAQNPA